MLGRFGNDLKWTLHEALGDYANNMHNYTYKIVRLQHFLDYMHINWFFKTFIIYYKNLPNIGV
jgi:hypothetical protein